MEQKEDPNFERAEIEGSSSSADLVSLNKIIPASVYENLPEPLKEITSVFSGREKDLVFLSSLGVISSCLPNVFGNYDGRKYAPNLYLFIIAPPASGKGVINWTKALIEPIHDDLLKQSQLRKNEWKISESRDTATMPKMKMKILPGNVSSSKFYSHFEGTDESLLIFESEADTLSNMLKQDWGNFSDMLRKAFHHEALSISRKGDDSCYEIRKPKLSIVLSGTQGQLKPLIQNKENGLLSRFMFYYFEGSFEWKDVSPNAQRVNYDDLFCEKGLEIKELYLKLQNCEEVDILLTEKQWAYFQNEIKIICDVVVKSNKHDFIPVIKRYGVIFFRICMILTCLRKKDLITSGKLKITTSDLDINTAIQIMKILIDHSLLVDGFYEKNSVAMNMTERKLFSQLPQIFKRSEGLEFANELKIPQRSYDLILKKWIEQKVLDKISQGQYQKNKSN